MEVEAESFRRYASTNAGWYAQAWAMNVMQKALEDVEGVHLAWGRETSYYDGALVLTKDPFPADPLAAWQSCLERGQTPAIFLDIKSGIIESRPSDIFVVAWPSDPLHIHIVPGRVWRECMIRGWRPGLGFVLAQCAVELDDVAAALRSLVEASLSSQQALSSEEGRPRRWYRNPSNGLVFSGWWVPPPGQVSTFTQLSRGTAASSEGSIGRLWRLMRGHESLSLHDNPLKPVVADLVLVRKIPGSGMRHQFLVEHKYRKGSLNLKPFTDPKFDWHVLVAHLDDDYDEGEYHFLFAGAPHRGEFVVAEDALGALDRGLRRHGRTIREALDERWNHLQRAPPKDEDDELELEPEPLGEGERGSSNEGSEGDDDDDADAARPGGAEAYVARDHRQWRVANRTIKRRARERLNDQCWFMGQNVVLSAHAGTSHGTYLFVEHPWTESERAAYAVSGMLPQPTAQSRAMPIAFGHRLYTTPTGEREYLKASIPKFDACSEIKTVFVVANSMRDVDSLDQVTLHAATPTGDCALCREEQPYVQWKEATGMLVFAAANENDAEVVDKIGRCLGVFSLGSGTLWQRLTELLDERETYSACTLGHLWQSSWRHGFRLSKPLREGSGEHPGPRRWAPCNECWSSGRLCDTSRKTCGQCKKLGLSCVRKKCTFFQHPQACMNGFCTEVHKDDGYQYLTDDPRDFYGADERVRQDYLEFLRMRMPVCTHCWDNGWHLQCSAQERCYMCTLHNAGGECTRTMCKEPDRCAVLSCHYAHSGFRGRCVAYRQRRPPVSVAPPAMSRNDLEAIAKERRVLFKTARNKSSPSITKPYDIYNRAPDQLDMSRK